MSAVKYQTMPPLSPDEYARLTIEEEQAIRKSPALIGDERLIEIAIHNAQWRKAHPTLLHRGDQRRVYFIRAPKSGLIKIGVAGDPLRRFKQISTMSPEPLELIGFTRGGRGNEMNIHQRFACQRVRGEWFSITSELEEFIKGVIE